MGKEPAFSQTSSSRPSQDPASQGPSDAADSDSRSQTCKPCVGETDPEDPDYEWRPAGQLHAPNAFAAVCELLNTDCILQDPAVQL